MSTDLRIHPDGYDLMLRGLFGIPALVSAPPPAAMVPLTNGAPASAATF
jgi:hypothetical protein